MYYLPYMKAFYWFLQATFRCHVYVRSVLLSIFESSSANSSRLCLGTSDPCTAPLTLPPFAYIFFYVGLHCKLHCFCITEYFASRDHCFDFTLAARTCCTTYELRKSHVFWVRDDGISVDTASYFYVLQ
jgi:hypothetical protein